MKGIDPGQSTMAGTTGREMKIEFAPELEAFRAEVAEFFATAPTPAIREAGRKTTSVFAPFKECMEWHRILYEKGWVAPHWPEEYGGTGWSVEQRFIFAEEYRKADLPPLLPQSLGMVGPLLIDIGTQEQKDREQRNWMRAAVIDADILGDKDLSHFPKAPAGMPYSSIEHSIMMIQARAGSCRPNPFIPPPIMPSGSSLVHHWFMTGSST